MNESHQEESQARQRFAQTVHRMRSEVDRLVEMAWTRGEEMWGQFRHSESAGDWTPELDIVETDQTVVVFVNVPGIGVDQVEITLVGNILEITAHAISLTLQTSDRVHKRERPTGKLHRLVNLPVPVDHDSAQAVVEQGVLKVEMKKMHITQGHKVPVSGGQATPMQPM
jgi:HSP20 family protein